MNNPSNEIVVLTNTALDYWKNGAIIESLATYEKALKTATDSLIRDQILYNCGLVAASNSEDASFPNYSKAISYLSKVKNLPWSDKAGWNLALSNLHTGNWKEGISKYHYRYSSGNSNEYTSVTFPALPLPRATCLKDLDHKKVLVLNEQGFGDEIMFSASFDFLKNIRTKKCVIQCYPELLGLFCTLFYGYSMNFFDTRSLSYDFVMHFDTWTSTGDLFAMANKENIRRSIPLRVKPLDEIDTQNSIGICFCANKKSPNHHLRDMPADFINDLKERCQKENITVYSLQKDPAPDWCIPLDEKADFYYTARLVSSLRRVVTIDTAVAHLAGRLGIPTTLVWSKHVGWIWKYEDENRMNMLYPTVEVKRI